jgi:hypothetical protein
MTPSLITRLLQISPAVAAAVYGAALVAGGPAVAGDDLPAAPEVALVTDIPSHEGRYLASLAPADESAWDGSEGWVISLRDASGEPVEGAALEIEAWQPDEMDGASQIADATALGAGQYRVDGVALGSAGWWNVKLAVAGAAADSLAFNVVLR